jgi:hypothetical protein
VARWTAADESPKSRKMARTPVKAITMPTNPKSLGRRMRDSTRRETARTTRFVHNAQSLARPPRSVRRLRSFIVLSRAAAYSKRSALGQGTIGRSNFPTQHITYVSTLSTSNVKILLQSGPREYRARRLPLNDGQSGREHKYFIAFFRLFCMVKVAAA